MHLRLRAVRIGGTYRMGIIEGLCWHWLSLYFRLSMLIGGVQGFVLDCALCGGG